MQEKSYTTALIAALLLHLSLFLCLLIPPSSPRPVEKAETRDDKGQMTPPLAEPIPEIVKAVHVDSQEVAATVLRLKEVRARKQKEEQLRQEQALEARKTRILEQQRLAKLKQEAIALEKKHKKQQEEEQKRFLALKKEREQQEKHVEELKRQKEVLQKEQALEMQKIQAEKQRQAQEKATAEAKLANMAGEVNKYKAMILNAISQRWILPDKVDKHLSSRFRIRLAPDGVVLEVSLLQSSGDAILDRSAEAAIYKASPLPVPKEREMFALFREISLTVRPENVRG